MRSYRLDCDRGWRHGAARGRERLFAPRYVYGCEPAPRRQSPRSLILIRHSCIRSPAVLQSCQAVASFQGFDHGDADSGSVLVVLDVVPIDRLHHKGANRSGRVDCPCWIILGWVISVVHMGPSALDIPIAAALLPRYPLSLLGG
jgi:hypothetical protein